MKHPRSTGMAYRVLVAALLAFCQGVVAGAGVATEEPSGNGAPASEASDPLPESTLSGPDSAGNPLAGAGPAPSA